eukprot:TRINITY_DN940_c0_g1_i1.p1 TRINITY_DN940_c0_g1~~TRINITY_DN940_c0_g1_i1.p1  ORF type:complete len:538 (-),score=105.77 TRINITY_DN940_c0_g1_i1:125-1738(-)
MDHLVLDLSEDKEDIGQFYFEGKPVGADKEEDDEQGEVVTTIKGVEAETTTLTNDKDNTKQKENGAMGFFKKMADKVDTISASIKNSIISPETQESFGHINSLLNKFFKDLPYSKLDVFFGLGLLGSYYNNAPLRSEDFVTEYSLIDNGRHYLKFADACYGWKLVYGMLYPSKVKNIASSVVGSKSNIKALCHHTGISPNDVVLTKFSSSHFHPGHFIALDHQRCAVVLAIRGTFSALDAITDLVATPTPFMDGQAHLGFLKCAKRKVTILSDILIEKLKEYPTYKLVVCGHSLGAAVATLFTLLFNKIFPEIPIHCYAYAPPSVTTIDIALSPHTKSLITSFVFEDDIVPRLTYCSLSRLKEVMCEILSQSSSTAQRSFQWFVSGGSLHPVLANKISNLMNCPPAPSSPSRNMGYSTEEVEIFPAGSIYYLYHPKNVPPLLSTLPSTMKICLAEQSNATLFNEVIVSDNMFTDHMPDKYEAAFEACWKVVNLINEDPTIKPTQAEPIQAPETFIEGKEEEAEEFEKDGADIVFLSA